MGEILAICSGCLFCVAFGFAAGFIFFMHGIRNEGKIIQGDWIYEAKRRSDDPKQEVNDD